MGSLAALPFAWVIVVTTGSAGLIICTFIVFAIGWYAAANTPEARNDPGWVVIDEVAGQWLTLSVVAPSLLYYVLGFLLFRFFDIVKPWPVRFLERSIPGALGVMVDDIAAALYAGLCLYGVSLLIGA